MTQEQGRIWSHHSISKFEQDKKDLKGENKNFMRGNGMWVVHGQICEQANGVAK